ncbi:hypothetical protein WT24_25605 [Burkholderia sp. MSMB1078WGS]|uniref:DUF1090 domain-containing protein n=1 Tax=Burkholderia sp. MSMB1078WGS TaxID=1637900 RepID=UPI000758ECD9|nr:DUF1090 domain-containing protein [Burkholderia sp. MSMB1078WGS]KVT04012.1 hypothetical protein WT24_25605 [Burkholderia sp. MSMB1078WGS]
MKKTLIATALPFILLAHSAASAGTRDCATRSNAIQAQIDTARQFGSTAQVERLKGALAQVKAHCTDAGQTDRAQRKMQDKQRDVQKVQNEVRKAEESVREAHARGDAKKIAKAQQKLADKQGKLREKMDNLRAAQADLAALKG